MKLEPLNDEILIRAHKQEESVSKGGIVLPKTIDAGSSVMGEVLAVSSGIMLEDGSRVPHAVVPGDVVLFDNRAVTEVKVNGETLALVRSLSLLAKVVKESAE